MTLLGLAGLAGAGKDTVANILVSNYGFKRLAFADNLKDMCVWSFRLKRDECHNNDLKERKFIKPIALNPEYIQRLMQYMENINKVKLNEKQINNIYEVLDDNVVFNTPRQLIQYVGTDIIRNLVSNTYHTDVVFNAIAKGDSDSLYVITDARFENERDLIKSKGGFNVLVDRGLKSKANGIGGHASENSLGKPEDYDYVLENKCKLEKLPEKVDMLINFLNEKAL